jgi:hypothetical protein
VERGRPFVEHRAELVVREERTVELERPRPAQGIELRFLSAGALDRAGPVFDIAIGGPLLDGRRDAVALEDELDAELRGSVVKIAPALAPDLRAGRPPAVRACREELHGLREARLARAVPPHDKRQTVPGRDLERRGSADAAKALNGD